MLLDAEEIVATTSITMFFFFNSKDMATVKYVTVTSKLNVYVGLILEVTVCSLPQIIITWTMLIQSGFG